MIFDTHAHYDDEQFDADREELLSGMKAGGVGMIVDAAATVASWDKILELTEKYPFLYGSVGVHPDEVGDLNEENFARMSELADRKKIVAIGEIGLDYYWDKEGHDLQKYWFIRQLELAGEKKLPVMIHSREAAADTMEIMKKYGKDLNGVIHCYSYSPEMAQEYVKMGYFIGVGGVVTFKNAKKLKETVKEIPLESIVLETDCPYLAPEPFRGKRNCSLYISYVAEKIAELKGISAEEVIRQTEENAKQLYQINESRLLKERQDRFRLSMHAYFQCPPAFPVWQMPHSYRLCNRFPCCSFPADLSPYCGSSSAFPPSSPAVLLSHPSYFCLHLLPQFPLLLPERKLLPEFSYSFS